MGRAPSLQQLLAAADSFLEPQPESTLVKAAAAGGSDVLRIAEALQGAEGGVDLDNEVELEKIAEAFNVLDAADDIENFKKAELFEKKAKAEGYSDEDVVEALSKVAAAKVKKNLPIMVAMGLADFQKKDKGSFFAKSRFQAYSNQPRTTNAKTQGY